MCTRLLSFQFTFLSQKMPVPPKDPLSRRPRSLFPARPLFSLASSASSLASLHTLLLLLQTPSRRPPPSSPRSLQLLPCPKVPVLFFQQCYCGSLRSVPYRTGTQHLVPALCSSLLLLPLLQPAATITGQQLVCLAQEHQAPSTAQQRQQSPFQVLLAVRACPNGLLCVALCSAWGTYLPCVPCTHPTPAPLRPCYLASILVAL